MDTIAQSSYFWSLLPGPFLQGYLNNRFAPKELDFWESWRGCPAEPSLLKYKATIASHCIAVAAQHGGSRLHQTRICVDVIVSGSLAPVRRVAFNPLPPLTMYCVRPPPPSKGGDSFLFPLTRARACAPALPSFYANAFVCQPWPLHCITDSTFQQKLHLECKTLFRIGEHHYYRILMAIQSPIKSNYCNGGNTSSFKQFANQIRYCIRLRIHRVPMLCY